MGFDRGFQVMALISLVVFLLAWMGLKRNAAGDRQPRS
jgi:hypothetical protein